MSQPHDIRGPDTADSHTDCEAGTGREVESKMGLDPLYCECENTVDYTVNTGTQ